MNTVAEILNAGKFSDKTLTSVDRKKTIAGKLKALSTMDAFDEMFPDSEAVFEKIFNARRVNAGNQCQCGWPIHKYVRLEGTFKYWCKGCRKQFSPLAGTPFERCKVELKDIVRGVFVTLLTKRGVTAAETSRKSGKPYRTEWRSSHREHSWMGLAVGKFLYENTTLQMDEVYPFIVTGLGSAAKRLRGLASQRIAKVVSMTDEEERTRTFVVSDVNTAVLKDIVFNNVSTTATIMTDGARHYNFLPNYGYTNLKCNHQAKQYSVDGIHVNHLEAFHANIKTTIHRIHKGVSEKHLQKYLDEMSFLYTYRHKTVWAAMEGLFESLPPLHVDINLNMGWRKKDKLIA